MKSFELENEKNEIELKLKISESHEKAYVHYAEIEFAKKIDKIVQLEKVYTFFHSYL